MTAPAWMASAPSVKLNAATTNLLNATASAVASNKAAMEQMAAELAALKAELATKDEELTAKDELLEQAAEKAAELKAEIKVMEAARPTIFGLDATLLDEAIGSFSLGEADEFREMVRWFASERIKNGTLAYLLHGVFPVVQEEMDI